MSRLACLVGPLIAAATTTAHADAPLICRNIDPANVDHTLTTQNSATKLTAVARFRRGTAPVGEKAISSIDTRPLNYIWGGALANNTCVWFDRAVLASEPAELQLQAKDFPPWYRIQHAGQSKATVFTSGISTMLARSTMAFMVSALPTTGGARPRFAVSRAMRLQSGMSCARAGKPHKPETKRTWSECISDCLVDRGCRSFQWTTNERAANTVDARGNCYTYVNEGDKHCVPTTHRPNDKNWWVGTDATVVDGSGAAPVDR